MALYAWELVTPEKAQEWLKLNPSNNRTISVRMVSRYARDMAEGRWNRTHQGIAFDVNGDLVDGQHRLHAVVQAGVPVHMLVVRGLGVDLRASIDQGLSRTAAYLTGLQTYDVAAVRILFWLNDGAIGHPSSQAASAGEVLDLYHGLSDSQLALLNRVKRGFSCPAPVVGSMLYADPIHPGRVATFNTQIRTGEMIRLGDPAYALRAWLTRHNNGVGVVPRDGAFATMQALRAHILGEPMSMIRLYDGIYNNLTHMLEIARGQALSPVVARARA